MEKELKNKIIEQAQDLKDQSKKEYYNLLDELTEGHKPSVGKSRIFVAGFITGFFLSVLLNIVF